MKSKGFWNLPNSLTVLRILLVPVMVWMLLEEPTQLEAQISVVIFVAAMITDIVDGWLARKWDLVSPVGAYLDPLADKLMTITVLIMLVPLSRARRGSWRFCCAARSPSPVRASPAKKMVIAAGSFGRLKTVYLGVAIGFCCGTTRRSAATPTLQASPCCGLRPSVRSPVGCITSASSFETQTHGVVLSSSMVRASTDDTSASPERLPYAGRVRPGQRNIPRLGCNVAHLHGAADSFLNGRNQFGQPRQRSAANIED